MAKRKKYRNEVRRILIVTLAAMMLIASNVFFVTIGKVHLRSGTDLSIYADSANTVTETITKRANISKEAIREL